MGKSTQKHVAVSLAVLLGTGTGALLIAAQHASAQVNPDFQSIALVQNGVVVGEVFRGLAEPPQPDTDPPQPDIDPPQPDAERYVEHWVLYPGYVYPSAKNRVVTELVPGFSSYANVEEFLRRVPFEKGSRYVRVDCNDGARIPGR